MIDNFSPLKFVHITSTICTKMHLEKLWIAANRIFSMFVAITLDNNLVNAREILTNHSPDPKKSCLCHNSMEDSLMDLQIIIPCYNVKDYIEKCIESVLRQETKYSFRITAIDDGSDDGTGMILDKYINDKRVQVIHQENRGFSGARNRGLNSIYGKYITFLDSDDTLETNAIEEWMSTAYRDNADIVEGGYTILKNNIRKNGRIHEKETNVLYNKLYGFPWGKVFNSKMFQNVHFPEKYWFEDTLCAYILYPMAKNISTINASVYCYLANPYGISAKSMKFDKSIDSFWITEQLLRDAVSLQLLNDNSIELYYEHTIHQIATNYTRAMFRGKDVRHAIFVLSCNLLDTYFSQCVTKKSEKTKRIEQAIRNKDYVMFVASVI